jgi:hypothetical protein
MEIKRCGSQPSNKGPITLAPIGGSNERSECHFLCCSGLGRGEGARAWIESFKQKFRPIDGEGLNYGN